MPDSDVKIDNQVYMFLFKFCDTNPFLPTLYYLSNWFIDSCYCFRVNL